MLSLDGTFHGNSVAVTHNYVLFLSQQAILDTDIFRSFQRCFKSQLVWSKLFSCSARATLQHCASSKGKVKKSNTNPLLSKLCKTLKKETFLSLSTQVPALPPLLTEHALILSCKEIR